MKKMMTLLVLAALFTGCALEMETPAGKDFYPATDVSGFVSEGPADLVTAAITAAKPLELRSATGFLSYYVPFFYVRATVAVSNLAYSKVVGICYSTDGWKTWKESDGEYAGKSGNLDLFRVQTTGDVAQAYDFAVYYKVNGKTYWDNNGGANYRVTTSRMCYKPGNVKMLDLYMTNVNGMEVIKATAAVKNLSASKVLTFVFSMDSGKTWREVPMYYNPGSGITPAAGYETWSVSVAPPATFVSNGDTFKCAIRYNVNGAVYWDNFEYYDYFLNQTTYRFVRIRF